MAIYSSSSWIILTTRAFIRLIQPYEFIGLESLSKVEVDERLASVKNHLQVALSGFVPTGEPFRSKPTLAI